MTLDIRGQRFGRLVAVETTRKGKRGDLAWRCLCDCGGETVVVASRLKRGETRSCTCLQKTHNLKHGHARDTAKKTPEYTAWTHMKDRCSSPGHPQFKDWGGRGIRVCARWADSFATFLADVGPRPSPDLSLDRIDNDGNYEPGNVRWATRSQQQSNQRRGKRKVAA
jgi:hypothetical protein